MPRAHTSDGRPRRGKKKVGGKKRLGQTSPGPRYDLDELMSESASSFESEPGDWPPIRPSALEDSYGSVVKTGPYTVGKWSKFASDERPWNKRQTKPPTADFVGQFSMFGAVPVAGHDGAPSVDFGASTRDQVAKVYISREHARSTGPSKPTPGPDYNIPGMSTLYQPSKKSASRVPFSTQVRPGMHEVLCVASKGRKHLTTMGNVLHVTPTNLIAPVKVNDIPYIGGESSMGRSVLRASSPMMKFGSSARKTLETPFFVTPGPNYDLPTFLGSTSTAVKYKPPAVPLPRKKKQVYTTNETSSMGSQPLSYKRSGPSWGFGGSTRDQWKDVAMAGFGPPRGRGAKSTWSSHDPKFKAAMQTVKARGNIEFV